MLSDDGFTSLGEGGILFTLRFVNIDIVIVTCLHFDILVGGHGGLGKGRGRREIRQRRYKERVGRKDVMEEVSNG